MAAMAKSTEEQALVERFRRGDGSAFDRIVERHSAEVAALANRLLGWPGDVDDVVQDVFVAAYVHLKRFRGQCQLRTWLFTITVNKCRSYRLRRRLRAVRASGFEPARDQEQGAERSAMDEETFARVRRAVQALPRKYREVIVLRYLQGLEPAEIGGLLGVRVNAVQVRLNRARKRLKERLGHLLEENS
ncbi:MAG: RNA polymerase sigma factor [Sedimentisphaerales bacterium]|nr:RNA polymerase sigma factor [Sedimentisphaerales bacterium]